VQINLIELRSRPLLWVLWCIRDRPVWLSLIYGSEGLQLARCGSPKDDHQPAAKAEKQTPAASVHRLPLLKRLAFRRRHPGVDLVQIDDRMIGERQGVQVAIRAEFRRHRRNAVTAIALH
jgi:hypothetical protein